MASRAGNLARNLCCDQTLIDIQLSFVMWSNVHVNWYRLWQPGITDFLAGLNAPLSLMSDCSLPNLVKKKHKTNLQTNCSKHFFRFWSCWLVVGFEGDHWRSMPSALTCRMCTCRAKVSSCKHWSSGVRLMQVTLGNMGAIPFCFHWILAICCSGDWQNVTSSEDSYRYSDKKSERSA